jgi:glucan phosphoethanolaminetransferase (alkaline phosphatase superfamily)
MNAAYFHLLINHLPIVGSFIGFLLIFYSSIISKDLSNIKAGLIILTLSCFSVLPVYFSGEGAEEIVEHLAGVSHDHIEEHEEIAELGLYVSLFVGLLSSIAFLMVSRKNSNSTLFTNITLFAAFLLVILFVLIGHTGGEIKHPEIEQSSDTFTPKLNVHDTDGD